MKTNKEIIKSILPKIVHSVDRYHCELWIDKALQIKEDEIIKEIGEIKFKFKTHPTANFGDEFLFGVDESLDELKQRIKGK